MMMMTMPATIESSADQARIRLPIRDALAPSATNTVEKPSTNITAEIITARFDDALALVIGDMLDGGAGQIDQIGRHQRQHAGRQKADEAGDQRGRDRDIVHHALIVMVASTPCPDRPDIGERGPDAPAQM